MSRKHLARSRFSIVKVLSLGSLILGTGLVCWALAGIWMQSADTAQAYRAPAATPSVPASQRATPSVSASQPAAPTVTETVAPAPVRLVFAKGDKIGTLSIPVLKQKWPIIEGTGDAELKRGVGHYLKSVLPGESDNCVLSGHRDTVFSGLGRVKTGDRVIIKTAADTYTYRVRRIRIVDKDDRTVIVPFDHAVLTLSTCYPFNYIGAAPRRYVLVADMVTP